MSGYHAPDSGTTLVVGGVPIPLPTTTDAVRDAGLRFVHQDLGLVPEASIVDNVLIGTQGGIGLAPIRWRRETRRVADVLGRLGLSVPPSATVGSLSAVERSLVAVARALVDVEPGTGVLVLDEPTAFLPEAEARRLFAVVRDLARSGAAIVYVSHRLDEVLSLTDRVSVLRDGALVFEGPTAALDEATLVRHILGEAVETFYPTLPPPGEITALSVRGLSGTTVADLSFDLRRGEILGLTGLVGSGYDEVPYLLFGALPSARGRLGIGDRVIEATVLHPPLARRLGLALLPADRQRASGAQDASLRENVGLPILSSLFRHGRLDAKAETAAARGVVRRFGVRPVEIELPLRAFSGGNQQKALLGKWLQTRPSVLLLHEPTQGVDVGAKQELFRHVEAAAAAGTAVLIASAETEDLANVCHRVAVLRRGELAGILSGAKATVQALDALAFGPGGETSGTAFSGESKP